MTYSLSISKVGDNGETVWKLIANDTLEQLMSVGFLKVDPSLGVKEGDILEGSGGTLLVVTNSSQDGTLSVIGGVYKDLEDPTCCRLD